MTDAATPDLRSVPMSDGEIDDLLRDRGFGVLSLAVDNVAYPVPMSFGYDGDRLYFVFLRTTEESSKATFARGTERAAFLVYDVESKHHWRSAIAYGSLEELPEEEWESAVLAVRNNAWHPNLFASASPMQGIRWWALHPNDVTGRKSSEYE